MTALNLSFAIYPQFKMSFEGEVEPVGALGYKFSGTLTMLDTRDVGYEAENIARLWHGGISCSWSYVDCPFQQRTMPKKYFRDDEGRVTIENSDGTVVEMSIFEFSDLPNESPKTFRVEGEGTRTANEPVEFCLGYNAFGNGFKDGNKKKLILSGPEQTIKPFYRYDGHGGDVTEVRVESGTARADGPTGFTIECGFSVRTPRLADGLFVTFGYKTSSSGWQYETFPNDFIIPRKKISGTRKPGEHIQVIVGFSDGPFGTYSYGDEFDYALPDEF